jgi:hypothetical protein
MYIALLLEGFAKLCYTLVQTGSIKMTATLDTAGDRLLFPTLALSLDLARQFTLCIDIRRPQNLKDLCLKGNMSSL